MLFIQRGDNSFYLALKAPAELRELAEEREFTSEAFITLTEIGLVARLYGFVVFPQFLGFYCLSKP